MKKLIPAFIGAVVCIILGWVGSNLYHVKKFVALNAHLEQLAAAVNSRDAAIEQLQRQSAEEIATLRGMIDSANTIIAGQDEEIAAGKETIEEKQRIVNTLLTAEVKDLIERYPALKSYCLAKDDVIATQGQTIFTLEQRDLQRVRVIEAQEKQIQLEREIASGWKQRFEGQQELHIAAVKALAHCRRSGQGTKLLALAGGAALGFLGSQLAR